MIKINSLTKLYSQNSNENFYVLKNINLKLKEGSLSVIYGESGSGKSTLLSIIAAITKPTSGELQVEGECITSYSDYFASSYREQKIGFITQEFHLFDAFTLEQNISVALALSSLNIEEIETKVLKITKQLHIEHKLKSKVSNLSGGEKQRCIIARALINNPKIILCDEPTANLDTKNAQRFLTILSDLKKMNKTIIIVTHDSIFDKLDMIDNKYIMKDGEIE